MIKPIELDKIYLEKQGELDILKQISDKTIHLIVTSPPYPMIEMWDKIFEKVNCKTYDEMHSFLTKFWKKCYDILIDGGILCINIGDATRSINGKFKLYPNHARIIEICEQIGFKTLPFILWKKPTNKPNAFLGSGFLPPNAYITLDCEFILIFRKGDLRKFLPKDKNRYDSQYTKEERDKYFSQIWEIRGCSQNNLGRRTASFPEEIPYRLIRMFSVKNDVVLDPFVGIGTTCIVAKKLNRKYIGIEIYQEYIDYANEELEKVEM